MEVEAPGCNNVSWRVGQWSHMAYEICDVLATGKIVTFLIKRAPKAQQPANNRPIINDLLRDNKMGKNIIIIINKSFIGCVPEMCN